MKSDEKLYPSYTNDDKEVCQPELIERHCSM